MFKLNRTIARWAYDVKNKELVILDLSYVISFLISRRNKAQDVVYFQIEMAE